MNPKLKAIAAMALAASLPSTLALASDATPKKHKKKAPAAATCDSCAQIDALRRDLQGQIDGLRNDLAAKDAALRDAQQKAADAQAAADRANTAAAGLADNASAVNALQSDVKDIKSTQLSIVTNLSDETAKIKQQLNSPDALYYKGINIALNNSFLEGATVWRSASEQSDINTPFTSVPLEHSAAAQLSEFFGTGRHSRIAIRAQGKISNAMLTGYYEMDWLGAGLTSNNNQSNSYVARQRQIWGQVALNSGWTFTTGQMWSLASEYSRGLQNLSEVQPSVIDPQYTAGYVWARQWGVHVTKDFGKKFFAGIGIENPQTLQSYGAGVPSNVIITGPGTGGGLYNSTAQYAYTLAPDVIVKLAFEPGWGHWEVFNINRFFRDRVYLPTGTINDSAPGNGIGGSFRGALGKYGTIGLKGLYGKGMGRYGDSTIADVTFNEWGGIVPLKAFSGLATLELTPNPRTVLYFNYGGDYVYRKIAGGGFGYGLPTTNMSGCNTETNPGNGNAGFAPGSCGGNNKDVQEASFGYWYDIYRGPHGRLRQGVQYSYIVRNLWSGAGGTTNPSGSAMGTNNMVFTSFRYFLP